MKQVEHFAKKQDFLSCTNPIKSVRFLHESKSLKQNFATALLGSKTSESLQFFKAKEINRSATYTQFAKSKIFLAWFYGWCSSGRKSTYRVSERKRK
ncbi:hypothetical protein [Bartonella quintana]|uniref:hypothetical protein n=1 Tax=Bartonella quintana TaxID=803 RepID=UPI00054DB590|nr:hypothetical protein [Bartonella quintana]QUG72494.1 hypothetical protein FOL54_06070 [Bartonella quintana]